MCRWGLWSPGSFHFFSSAAAATAAATLAGSLTVCIHCFPGGGGGGKLAVISIATVVDLDDGGVLGAEALEKSHGFTAATQGDNPRDGLEFREGDLGLGYYEDPPNRRFMEAHIIQLVNYPSFPPKLKELLESGIEKVTVCTHQHHITITSNLIQPSSPPISYLPSTTVSVRQIGHNFGNDISRLEKDYSVIVPRDTLIDTMNVAKSILGLRESWNSNSNWGLSQLSQHLLGQPLDKTERLTDWEGTLSDEQVYYSAMDSVQPLVLRQCLVDLKDIYKCKQGMKAFLWNYADEAAADEDFECQRQRIGGHVVWHDSERQYAALEGILLGRSNDKSEGLYAYVHPSVRLPTHSLSLTSPSLLPSPPRLLPVLHN